MTGYTLQEALLHGQGNERPFRCHVHADHNASASVNVAKKVWYCFSCRAKGTVDSKKVPTVEDMMAMSQPKEAPRVYPRSYYRMFEAEDSYWHTRFEPWVVKEAGLGEDPITGHATFPVRRSDGRMAGVGRRDPDPEAKPRYKYPPRWSAATVLHGIDQRPHPMVVLVEGAADQVSLQEVGVYARGCYGAGIHFPQIEELIRLQPRTIALGFDTDGAGRRATEHTFEALEQAMGMLGVDIVEVPWPMNDPAECTQAERRAALCSVVGDRYVADWNQRLPRNHPLTT